jgi:methionyl-tRNA formyltransferase
MRILCCLNRDLASNLALNLLLPTLAGHTVRVGLTERVGQVQADEPLGRRQLRSAEQTFPNLALFPLIERAAQPDTHKRNLTFAEIQQLRGIPIEPLANPNSGPGLESARSFAPDLIVTIRYGAILKPPCRRWKRGTHSQLRYNAPMRARTIRIQPRRNGRRSRATGGA